MALQDFRTMDPALRKQLVEDWAATADHLLTMTKMQKEFLSSLPVANTFTTRAKFGRSVAETSIRVTRSSMLLSPHIEITCDRRSKLSPVRAKTNDRRPKT